MRASPAFALLAAALPAASLSFFPPDGAGAAPASRARYVMGTVCEIAAEGPPGAVTAAFEELERWDRVLSLHKPDSEANRVNREAAAGPVRVSEDYWGTVSLAIEVARRSGGAFDPTVRPLAVRGRAALPLVGYRRVALDAARRTVGFARPGMALDFGGIGKGLALDRAALVLRRLGVRRALLNFGGQILAVGGPWRVELPAGAMNIRDCAVSSSGDSERPGHILSPFTGLPVRGATRTVVAPTGAEADAWSTAIFVMQGSAPPAFKACAGCRMIEPGGAS